MIWDHLMKDIWSWNICYFGSPVWKIFSVTATFYVNFEELSMNRKQLMYAASVSIELIQFGIWKNGSLVAYYLRVTSVDQDLRACPRRTLINGCDECEPNSYTYVRLLLCFQMPKKYSWKINWIESAKVDDHLLWLFSIETRFNIGFSSPRWILYSVNSHWLMDMSNGISFSKVNRTDLSFVTYAYAMTYVTNSQHGSQ